MPITYEWRGAFTNAEVNALHAEAFETRLYDESEWDWERSSPSTASAGSSPATAAARRLRQRPVGRVRPRLAAGHDGRPVRGRQGIGTQVVATARKVARAAGCEFLHVDFDDDLRSFYYDACGFVPSNAGLIDLTSAQSEAPTPSGP